MGETPSENLARARLLVASNSLSRAEAVLDSTLALDDLDSTDVRSSVSLLLAEIQLKRGNFHAADLILEPLTLKMTTGSPDIAIEALVLRCRAMIRMGSYEDAVETCSLAFLDAEGRFGLDHRLVGMAQHYRGLAFHESGKLREALLNYQAAVETRTRVHGKYSREVAATQNNVGNVYWRLGLLPRALETHHAALLIKTEILPEDHPDLGVALSNLANLYAQSRDSSRAEALYLEALRVYSRSETNPLFLAKAQDNFGELLLSGGRHTEAREYLEASNEAFKSLLPDGHASIGVSEVHLGNLAVREGDLSGFDRMRRGASDMLDAGRPDAAYEIGSLAELLYSAGLDAQADSTIAYASRLIEARFGPDNIGLVRLRNIRAAALIQRDKPQTAQLLVGRSIDRRLASQTAVTSNIRPPHVQRSDAEFTNSVLLWCEAVRLRLGSSALSLSEAVDASRQLQSIVRLLEAEDNFASELPEEGPGTPLEQVLPAAVEVQSAIQSRFPSKASLDLLFRYSEMRLAGDLHAMSARSNAADFAHIPDELVSRERSLVSRIGLANREIAAWRSGNAGPIPHSIVANLYAATDSLEDLVDVLHAGYPRYHAMRFAYTTSTISQVQDAVGEDRQLIQYTSIGDTLFATVLSRDSVARISLGAVIEIELLIQDYLEALHNRDRVGSQRFAERLYRRLLEPLPLSDLASRLVVIPDGPLLDLPMESLVKVDPESGESRYVIEDKSLNYNYSATLFLQHESSGTGPEPHSILVAAPVFRGGISVTNKTFGQTTIAFPELRGTGREAVALDHLFDRYRDRSSEPAQVLLGKEATEARLKSADLTPFQYIHLATHGHTNSTEPSLSGLLFEPGDGEDGVLHVGEVLGMELNADMVVLSACRTGITSRASGAGLMGLSRAFMYAGTNTVVASLWNSDDAYTASTMAHFYENLLQGQSKAEALRQAKLTMMEDPEVAASPELWAPFILIGES